MAYKPHIWASRLRCLPFYLFSLLFSLPLKTLKRLAIITPKKPTYPHPEKNIHAEKKPQKQIKNNALWEKNKGAAII